MSSSSNQPPQSSPPTPKGSRNGGRSTPVGDEARQNQPQQDTGAQQQASHFPNTNKSTSRQYGNPQHKKNWQQKKPVQSSSDSTASNSQNISNSQNNQDLDRKRRNNRDNRNGGSSSNQVEEQNNVNGTPRPTAMNGDGNKKYEPREQRKTEDYYKRNRQRRDRDVGFKNQNKQQQYSGVEANTQPSQQPHQRHTYPPHLQSQIDETIRINSLISNRQQITELTPQEIQLIEQVREVVPNYSAEDIYHTLQQNNYNHERTVSALLGDEGSSRNLQWSEVVKKRLKNVNDTFNNMQTMHFNRPRERARPPRGAERQQREQAGGGSTAASPPTAEHASGQADGNGAGSQANEAQGEVLLMGLSKAIEQQLAEIQQKTAMLMSMKAELDAIHVHGHDQLASLQAEQTQLTAQRDQLHLELQRVNDRLHHIGLAIQDAEKEKFSKLNDLRQKSISLLSV
jgi:hypothetical protein